MFIVEIIGGLGNQMFCYAFAQAIENHYGKGSVILYTGRFREAPDNRTYELKYVFGINDPVIDDKKEIQGLLDDSWSFFARLRRKLFGPRPTYFNETIYTYDPRVFQLNTKVKKIYLQGLWKDEKYFKNIRPLILDKFRFKTKLNEINERLLHNIEQSDSVSIHVRRGDYISAMYKDIVGDVCTPDYYRRCIDYLSQTQQDMHFFVFSDDIEWVKDNFDFLQGMNVTYIDHNKGTDSYIDMQLMSRCKHNIIANSTFSWWGAWLNTNPDRKVLAPKMWYKDPARCENNDIVPAGWIKIDNK